MSHSKKVPLADLGVPSEAQGEVRGGKGNKLPPRTGTVVLGPVIGTNIGGQIGGGPKPEEDGA